MPHPQPELLHRFVDLVYELCTTYNASVSNWGRTSAHNQLVKGHLRSWHLWSRGALAVDLVFDNHQVASMAAEAAIAMGLEIELTDDHLHIEMDLGSWKEPIVTIIASTEKSANQRDATKPLPGATRDALVGALGGWAAAAVLAKSGNPDLAFAADIAMQEWIPAVFGLVFGGFTLFRKTVQERIAK